MTEDERLRGERAMKEMENEEPTIPVEEDVYVRYARLKLIHPRLRIALEKGFNERSTGSYPMYQQMLFAAFVSEQDDELHAGAAITLSKIEWTNKDVQVYDRKKREALGRILDWVESGVVPMRVGGEDQVKVKQWGTKEQIVEDGPRIQLTDLE